MSKASIRLAQIHKRQLKVSYSGLPEQDRQFVKLHEAYQRALKTHEMFWKYEAKYKDNKADHEKTDWDRLAQIEKECDLASERLDNFVKKHNISEKEQRQILHIHMLLNVGSGGSF